MKLRNVILRPTTPATKLIIAAILLPTGLLVMLG
jgi:hypothetical protein